LFSSRFLRPSRVLCRQGQLEAGFKLYSSLPASMSVLLSMGHALLVQNKISESFSVFAQAMQLNAQLKGLCVF
jgi:hypothetical protein